MGTQQEQKEENNWHFPFFLMITEMVNSFFRLFRSSSSRRVWPEDPEETCYMTGMLLLPVPSVKGWSSWFRMLRENVLPWNLAFPILLSSVLSSGELTPSTYTPPPAVSAPHTHTNPGARNTSLTVQILKQGASLPPDSPIITNHRWLVWEREAYLNVCRKIEVLSN